MAHPIFVCLEHKLTFHTRAVAGRHATKHGRDYSACLDDKIFVEIGECSETRCDKNKLLPATEEELRQATEKRGRQNQRLCPSCSLPMPTDDALCARSHDGKTVICSLCGQIESFEEADPARAEGFKLARRRAQAALYGLDEHGNPKLPKAGAG
ncbi:hypothetical protein ES703_41652 [subsurface metagenome]